MDMERLAKIKRRLENWHGDHTPISINTALELVELAEKGLGAQRLEKEAQWLATHCASFVFHDDPKTIRKWREAATNAVQRQEKEEDNAR